MHSRSSTLIVLATLLLPPVSVSAGTSDDAWIPVVPRRDLGALLGADEDHSSQSPGSVDPRAAAIVERCLALPPILFEANAQPLGLVARQLADQLGLAFMAPSPTSPHANLPVTVSAHANPWELLRAILDHHGLTLAFDGRLWSVAPPPSALPEVRIHALGTRTLESFGGEGGGMDPSRLLEAVRTVLAEPASSSPGETDPDPRDPGGQVLWDSEGLRLWVRALPSAHDRLADYLAGLGAPGSQVALEVRFVTTSDEPEQLLGVAWSPVEEGLGVSLGGLAADLDLAAPGSFRAPVARLSASDIGAKLQAMSREQNRHEVRLVRQTGRTGRPLEFRDTRRIPVVQSTSRIGGDTLSSQSTIDFVEVGTSVDLVPRVLADGSVLLRLDLTVSSVTGNISLDGNDYPVTSRQTYVGEVTVPPGGTLALGGFERTLEATSRTGVPGLSRIPGVGMLFGTKGRRADRAHLVIVVTPTVIPVSGVVSAAAAPSP